MLILTRKDMTARPKQCACKGIRSCLHCETGEGIDIVNGQTNKTVYLYCELCNKAWSGVQDHPVHDGDSIDFCGIFVLPGFLSEAEEEKIEKEIYNTPFIDSQSGRRKQDYGPKVNFKRKKIKCDRFSGLPPFSQALVDRMRDVNQLKDFLPVEQCHLEYMPERGSAIDPHFDDFWLWGERLVTINLLSDTYLYFTNDEYPSIEVKVLLKQRCLLVVYGAARHKWKHGIHRKDIHKRRLAITLRELSDEFLEGGERCSDGKDLLDIALKFKGQAVS